MGYNTGVMILNDALDTIRDHPKQFVDGIWDAVGLWRGRPTTFPVGNYGNPATVFHMGHADQVGVYSIGANCVHPMYIGFEHYHTTDAGKLELLRQMAKEMGYDLRRRPKRPCIVRA
jgi:hypothetical protein